MYVKWDNEESQTVTKTEAEVKLTALVADQFIKLRREIERRRLNHPQDILALISRETNRILGVPTAVGGLTNLQGFVVCTTTKGTDGLPPRTMFMVDRGRIRDSWWSDDLEDALIYDNEHSAQRRLETIHHNDPRVVTYAEAQRLNDLNGVIYTETVEVAG